MKLREFAQKDISWLKVKDTEEGTIVSTRIRLARNISRYPFPGTASPEQLAEVLNTVFEACDKNSFFGKSKKIRLDDLAKTDRRLLLERHIISHEHAVSSVHGGVVIDEREQLSIMVNEEDHLRIQYIDGGLNLFEAWDVICKVDDELSSLLGFAYSDKWGYLTACPTNTGTGMRASCQMYLPGLGMSNDLKNTMESINKMGMVVRGLYGEGTRIMGNMLQISNQVTLGISEQRIIDSLKRLVMQVAQREKKVRALIMDKDQDTLKDTVYRSRGILSNAYKISFEEALDLISNLRFGTCMKLIDMNVDRLNNLMIKIQPAHIQEMENTQLEPSERDRLRAELIKKEIN